MAATSIAGRYRIRARHDVAAFGTRFHASTADGDKCLLTVLRPEIGASDGLAERFHAQLDAQAELPPKLFVRVLDSGSAKDGTLYVAGEPLQGRTLATILAEDGPLDPKRVLAIGWRLKEALGILRQRGLAHGGLTTQAVLVDQLGGNELVRIRDVGLANLLRGPETRDIPVAKHDAGLAALLEVSPDKGAYGGAHANDELALGCLLYEAVTGRGAIDTNSQSPRESAAAAARRLRRIDAELGKLVESLVSSDAENEEQTQTVNVATAAAAAATTLPLGKSTAVAKRNPVRASQPPTAGEAEEEPDTAARTAAAAATKPLDKTTKSTKKAPVDHAAETAPIPDDLPAATHAVGSSLRETLRGTKEDRDGLPLVPPARPKSLRITPGLPPKPVGVKSGGYEAVDVSEAREPAPTVKSERSHKPSTKGRTDSDMHAAPDDLPPMPPPKRRTSGRYRKPTLPPRRTGEGGADGQEEAGEDARRSTGRGPRATIQGVGANTTGSEQSLPASFHSPGRKRQDTDRGLGALPDDELDTAPVGQDDAAAEPPAADHDPMVETATLPVGAAVAEVAAMAAARVTTKPLHESGPSAPVDVAAELKPTQPRRESGQRLRKTRQGVGLPKRAPKLPQREAATPDLAAEADSAPPTAKLSSPSMEPARDSSPGRGDGVATTTSRRPKHQETLLPWGAEGPPPEAEGDGIVRSFELPEHLEGVVKRATGEQPDVDLHEEPTETVPVAGDKRAPSGITVSKSGTFLPWKDKEYRDAARNAAEDVTEDLDPDLLEEEDDDDDDATSSLHDIMAVDGFFSAPDKQARVEMEAAELSQPALAIEEERASARKYLPWVALIIVAAGAGFYLQYKQSSTPARFTATPAATATDNAVASAEDPQEAASQAAGGQALDDPSPLPPEPPPADNPSAAASAAEGDDSDPTGSESAATEEKPTEAATEEKPARVATEEEPAETATEEKPAEAAGATADPEAPGGETPKGAESGTADQNPEPAAAAKDEATNAEGQPKEAAAAEPTGDDKQSAEPKPDDGATKEATPSEDKAAQEPATDKAAGGGEEGAGGSETDGAAKAETGGSPKSAENVPDGMVEVAAGRYPIGCAPYLDRCETNAMPPQQQQMGRFAIMVTEVSVGAYRKCVRAGDCKPARTDGACAGVRRKSKAPATCVTWQQAQDYCRYMHWRLPTEAEWEVSARGKHRRQYPWGSQWPSCDRTTMAKIDGDGCGTGGPAATGAKSSDVSWCGVRDLAGNVSEWVADVFGPYRNARTQHVGPTLAEVQLGHRVVRGGSYSHTARTLPVVHQRLHAAGAAFRPDLGFRCAVSVTARTASSPAPTGEPGG